MSSSTIDALVADCSPVRPIAPRHGIALVLAAMAGTIAAVAALFGLRGDVTELRPPEMVMMRSGALLLLGAAALAAIAASVRPSIGERRDGWRWAVAAGALFPLSSAVLMLRSGQLPADLVMGPDPLACLGISLAGAGVIGGVLTAWLRRGAVTELPRAGLLVGLAAGAFGAFAYNLHCPSLSLHYVAVWYSLAIGLSAIAGRLLVPRMLRW
ncbi:NrsF family protein [Sphingomonas japonica]|uniref:DUF1109 domain-containing protein n=1 Tax=Sphingomonas japonica TaxID=511662 RepID=A0ABX0U032_9SPHN|nr:DUF1109 domain-containing protein [Sphingomonas japonica]NIJ22762.1 hypothetical protein [Sphingomonas japonica]